MLFFAYRTWNLESHSARKINCLLFTVQAWKASLEFFWGQVGILWESQEKKSSEQGVA
jgi:hypothetical protein